MPGNKFSSFLYATTQIVKVSISFIVTLYCLAYCFVNFLLSYLSLFSIFSLDKVSSNENLQKDLLDYINFRLNNSPSIQSNVASTSGKLDGGSSSQFRFSQHLLGLSRGSFLFAKLTLDLLERGQLVAKSSGYKASAV
jgi:hypothetical protein